MFNSPLILSPSFPLLRKIESRRVFPSATTVTIYLPMSVPCSVSSPVTVDKFNGVRKRTVLFLMHQNPSPLTYSRTLLQQFSHFSSCSNKFSYYRIAPNRLQTETKENSLDPTSLSNYSFFFQ